MKKMIKITCKLTFEILLFTCFAVNVTAQFTQKRILERIEPVSSETTVEINNKYGTIEITEWNKDSVSIIAEIEAFAPSQSRTEKMLEGIDIEISSTKYKVRAQTNFAQTLNMFFENIKNMTNKLISYDSRVQINYIIKAPEYINLRLENRYGDIYLENSGGTVYVSLSNGSFKAHSLTKSADLRTAFCNVVINNVRDCDIDASFSELIIDEAENLNIKSLSSRFDIKHGKSVFTESRRDKFFIGTVNFLKANSYFTRFWTERLLTEADITARYGEIIFEMVDNNFKTINLNTGYNDIKLTFDPAVSYNIDIRHINSSVILPSKNTEIEKSAINEERKEYILTGIKGKNPGNRKVKI
ncbi:MAG: hypothetical protein ACUVTX_11670, partial [Bacteroidales bacterium]